MSKKSKKNTLIVAILAAIAAAITYIAIPMLDGDDATDPEFGPVIDAGGDVLDAATNRDEDEGGE